MIEEEYFNWLCSKVDDADFNPSKYQLLLQRLHHTDFIWTMENDKDRAIDGIELRTQFAKESDLDSQTVKMQLQFPCSMMEMMVALAIRCETQIMIDLFVGERIGRWFKVMLKSLDLYYETDEIYDEEWVDFVLREFMDRAYEPNGVGGLFRINDSSIDLRQLEIWSQMNVYLCNLEAG